MLAIFISALLCLTSLLSASITAKFLLSIKRRKNLLTNRTLLFHLNPSYLFNTCFYGLKAFSIESGFLMI